VFKASGNVDVLSEEGVLVLLQLLYPSSAVLGGFQLLFGSLAGLFEVS